MLFHTSYHQIIKKEHVETWYFKNQDWKLALHNEIKLGPRHGAPKPDDPAALWWYSGGARLSSTHPSPYPFSKFTLSS